MHVIDNGPEPEVLDVYKIASVNRNFRTTLWTGKHLQLTVMSIPPGGEVGMEIHKNTDQYIRVEQGIGMAVIKMCRGMEKQQIYPGCGVFIPAGTYHNIVNCGRTPLKLSSVYAPPQHKPGTVHRTKADSDAEEYKNSNEENHIHQKM